MNLHEVITLFAGGLGSGCNPEVAEQHGNKCGPPFKNGSPSGGGQLQKTYNDEREYSKAKQARDEVISKNKSRRLRGEPSLEVPPKPKAALLPYAYEPDGTYGGLLKDSDDLPEGHVLVWAPPSWASPEEHREAKKSRKRSAR
jgi:hypothetical protein